MYIHKTLIKYIKMLENTFTTLNIWFLRMRERCQESFSIITPLKSEDSFGLARYEWTRYKTYIFKILKPIVYFVN